MNEVVGKVVIVVGEGGFGVVGRIVIVELLMVLGCEW